MFCEESLAGDVESRMAPDGIVKLVDVAANSPVRLLASVEDGPPNELGFQGFDERLAHGAVIGIPLAGHRYQDGVALQLALTIDRAILAATIGVMDQSISRTAPGHGFAQGGESQLAMLPVAASLANYPAYEQV